MGPIETIATILISSGVGAIMSLLTEDLRYKNSVKKTVHDKLHYDQAKIIETLYEKSVILQYALEDLTHDFSIKNVNKFEKAHDEFHELLFAKLIYFDDQTKNKLFDFSQKIYDLNIRKILELPKESYEAYLNEIRNAQFELRKSFSNILGVKVK